jgi:CheY-like chemotaxis protein
MNLQPVSAPRKVLIIDDNADAATLLAMFINAHGHETAVAHSGREGLTLASTFAPEIAIVDLGMPGMSGYDVAIALRSQAKTCHIYIAALTGWNDAQTKARVIASGFNKHW